MLNSNDLSIQQAKYNQIIEELEKQKEEQEIIDSRTAAAALILEPPLNFISEKDTVRIAFDADAVLFSDESEQIYKSKGMDAFHKNESDKENMTLKGV